jgi:hypothetical protein
MYGYGGVTTYGDFTKLDLKVVESLGARCFCFPILALFNVFNDDCVVVPIFHIYVLGMDGVEGWSSEVMGKVE